MSFETYHAPTTEVEDVLVTYRDPDGELVSIRAARALFDLTIANGSAELLRIEEIGVRLLRPEILNDQIVRTRDDGFVDWYTRRMIEVTELFRE